MDLQAQPVREGDLDYLEHLLLMDQIRVDINERQILKLLDTFYSGRRPTQGTGATGLVKRKKVASSANSVGRGSLASKAVSSGRGSSSAKSPVYRFRCLIPAGEKEREICF